MNDPSIKSISSSALCSEETLNIFLLLEGVATTFQTHVNIIYGLYLKCLDKFQEEVPFTKQGKMLISICNCKLLIFKVEPNKMFSPIQIFICGET
jgi:hypothetical protein